MTLLDTLVRRLAQVDDQSVWGEFLLDRAALQEEYDYLSLEFLRQHPDTVQGKYRGSGSRGIMRNEQHRLPGIISPSQIFFYPGESGSGIDTRF